MIFLSYSDYTSVLLTDLLMLFELCWYNQNNLAWSFLNLAKRLWWIVSQKYLTIFSCRPLLRKAPSKMFGIVLNTPLGYAHFAYIVQDQFVTVLWFKDFYRRFGWIPEFGKVGLLLNYIKRFRLYFHYF